MSFDTDRYRLKKLSGQSLAVVECGIQICHPGHAVPRLRYPDYSVHFVLEGKGVFCKDGVRHEVTAGQGFLITPGMVCEYTADEKLPWKYVYASFRGADDDVLVRNAGLDNQNVLFSFPLDENMINNIYAMHSAGKRNEARGYDVTGYFLLCMSQLVRQNLASEMSAASGEDHVRRACLYIDNNLAEIRSVAEIASYAGLERSYLYKLFCRHCGMPPSRYLMQCRLERAAEMLENQELSIADVGALVGFYDTSHFYRAFSAKFGTTPKKYREDHYGGEK